MIAGLAHAEPSRPVQGVFGEREVSVANHANRGIVELYISPQSADAWGQDQLGDDVLAPSHSMHLKLGRTRDCSFDMLAIYDDTSREESRGLNLCRDHEAIFDGSTASAPQETQGPQRSLTVTNASPRPIQQLFLSPPDAAQWGDDRLVTSALSVGEQRRIEFRGDCKVDVRVVFANRAAEERRGLDLCRFPLLKVAPGWTTEDRKDTHD